MSYKKSNVTGRTWSTPFNTPFFFRWGEWSIKVPMECLREEYDAWEELQRRRRPQGTPTDQEAGETNARPSLTPNAFDWAEDVEQELFSDGSASDSDDSSSNLESAPDSDTDRGDCPIVDPTAPVETAVAGASIDEGEEEVAVPPGGDEATTTPELTTPTPTTNIDNTVYRVIDVSTANNTLSIRMVEDGRPIATGGSTTAQKASEVIQFLAGAGLLKLDTYETVFEIAARGCASGEPFWLHDPALGYEIVV
ncbi:hypothetical protein GSI_07215 [Ganoderma sinense ZZ0214-1]|uniref:Uncharacterized protein n=1 Tax=Ganoderma sinense ZZ0214-1 TaxID=1077348 RepID=A0A2G8S9S7_9APHY|nr:hypothetical protein GSI_07215 [Ganoderma sinense ZZ0214-1]